MTGALSDCQTEIIDGKAAWYVTENGGASVFYQIESAGGSSFFRLGISTGVSLADSVLAKLGSCETVLAASHNAQARPTGVLQSVPRGWTLYFLDKDGRPVCRPFAR